MTNPEICLEMDELGSSQAAGENNLIERGMGLLIEKLDLSPETAEELGSALWQASADIGGQYIEELTVPSLVSECDA